MSAQANAMLVLDASTHTIVKKVKHPDLVRPANGKFHPNGKRFYASGRGKVTVWDTTDPTNPVHFKTITPSLGSTGEYRGDGSRVISGGVRRGTLCRLALVVVLTVGALSARAGADPPCRAEAPGWPLPGSSWVLARTATGSFGSASHAVTIDLLGEQVWRGRHVMVLREGPVRTYLDMRYRLLALEHGGRMQAVYEPFDPLFAWPLVVGRQWTGEYSLTGASGGSPRLMRVAYRVDALEEVTVPAGRFVAFRVRRHDATETIVCWWSPELGIPIRMTRERSRFDPLGPGSLLEELRSWRFNPGDEP